jgi:DNA modification methylase
LIRTGSKDIKKNSSRMKSRHKRLRTTKQVAKKRRAAVQGIVREPEMGYAVRYEARSNKNIDESWDFRKSNTKEYTHCFHAYPAMMIPQVARRIIENYGRKTKVLFDPYRGKGTSLMEANFRGLNAIRNV